MLYFVIKALHLISDFLLIGGMIVNAFVISMVPPTIRTGVISALRRYNSIVTTGALAGAWVFGLWLAIGFTGFDGGWLHAKLLFVILLSALHGMQSAALRKMEADPHLDANGFVRAGMPITILCLVVVVALAVIKPF